MKRIIFFLLLSLITATVSFGGSIINDIDNFSKLFPRIEGSVNEQQTINYIISRLDSLGADYSITDFKEAEGFHSYSSYIDVVVRGRSDNTLITVVPLDLKDSVTDRFSGCWPIAAALCAIEHFLTEQPPVSMRFLFLGGEQGTSGSPLGTRYFLEQFYSETPTAFIYLNIEKVPSALRIRSGADGFSSPYYLFKLVLDSLSTADIPWFHSNSESILFRLSSVGTESLIKEYLRQGYPAVEIRTHSADGDMISDTQVINFYHAATKRLSNKISEEWDVHYIFGISEWNYIIIYIAVIGLLMVYPIFRRKHFGWYMHTLMKNFWSLPLLFAFTFGLLAISSLITGSLLSLIDFPELWKYKPLSVFMLKINIALFFYTISFRFISRLPFSRRGSFYSISAIFFLTAGLFVLTWLDLSLSFFALWPLLLIFLFTITKNL